MVKEKVLEKLKKLLNKKDSAEQIGSLKEAETFAAKVTELLTKYNLSMLDISEDKDSNGVVRNMYKHITPKKNEGDWIFALYNTLARYNFCKVIIYNEFEHGSKKSYLTMIGEPDDIEVVLFLGDQLSSKIRYLAKQNYAEYKGVTSIKRGKFFRHFYQGAVAGLATKLHDQREAQKKEVSKVTDLVLVKDHKIEDFIAENIPNLSKGRRKSYKSSLATGLGYKAGKGVDINKGVDQNKGVNFLAN